MATLSTKQLTEALDIRKKIDALDAQKETLQSTLQRILSGLSVTKSKKAPAKKKAAKATRKPGRPAGDKRRLGKKSQKQMVREVLGEATGPLSADAILGKLKARGLKTQAKNPKKTLGVLLYTDDAIESGGRGLFKLKSTLAPAKPKAKKKKAAAKKSA